MATKKGFLVKDVGADISLEAAAFGKWMKDYIARTGDKFPSFSTVLKEAYKMGYRLVAKAQVESLVVPDSRANAERQA